MLGILGLGLKVYCRGLGLECFGCTIGVWLCVGYTIAV